MLKFISISILFLLCLNTTFVFAKDDVDNQAKKDAKSTPYYTVNEDYDDFSANSYYISDEQLEDAKNIDKIDDNTSFIQKIINSSHFSSGTATKTYIPINKSL